MFDSLRGRLETIFDGLKGKGKLSEEDINAALREVRRALLEADVNYKVVKSFVSSVRERATGQEVLGSITPGQQVVAIVYEELSALMGEEPSPLYISPKPPTVYLMAGLQGSGKTTTSVKLAKRLSRGHKPMVVACDLRRPAAVERLKFLADQAGVDFFGPSDQEESVLQVASDALKYASEHLVDLIIFDTAGRLHVDEDLMEEIRELKEVVNPDEILLVVDSMTGQESVKVAEAFNDSLSLTGLILSKVDGDARGGASLAVKASTGVPVKFAGVGEGIEALEIFDAKRMAQRILGMGDVEGLAEKVRKASSGKEAEEISRSLKKKRLSLEDMLVQFEQLEKMGPVDKIFDMIPGASKIKGLNSADIDESRLRRTKAIIQSMTSEERKNPQIIKGSRRRRIAQGSGTSVQMVNQVLKQHNQMNKMWKSMGKGKKRKQSGLPGNFF